MKNIYIDILKITGIAIAITLSCFFILGYTYSYITDFIVVFICAFIMATASYFSIDFHEI